MERYKIDKTDSNYWIVYEWNQLRPEQNKWDIPVDQRLHYLFETEAEAQAVIDEIVG